MNSHETPSHPFEKQPKQKWISDVLPRYYEAYGEHTTYEVIRSIPIDGHEVAWMEYRGTVQYDITGEGKEGQAYCGRILRCVCDFEEDVSWKLKENGKPVGIGGTHNACLAKKAALHLRHLELRREYNETGVLDTFRGYEESFEDITFDLMEKVRNGDFVESGEGTGFWGGYFYLQTVASIMDLPDGMAWGLARTLTKDKKISLNGAIVCDYIEPKPPAWEPHTSLELEGYTITALLPAHSNMPQEWQFEITNAVGEKVEMNIPNLPLMYEPVFGVDADDLAQAEVCIAQLANELEARKT